MSGRIEELPLSRGVFPRVFIAALLAALLGGGTLSAQEPPGIRALVQGGAGGTRVHGETAALLAFGAGIRVTPSLSVGGAGRVVPGPVEIGRVALRNLEMSFGYGGIFVEYEARGPSPSWSWIGSLLVGAGNADVREVETSLRLDSDNFFVSEPGVGIRRDLPWRLSASARASWRLVWGVEDLRGVAASDLSSPVVGIGLTIHPL